MKRNGRASRAVRIFAWMPPAHVSSDDTAVVSKHAGADRTAKIKAKMRTMAKTGRPGEVTCTYRGRRCARSYAVASTMASSVGVVSSPMWRGPRRGLSRRGRILSRKGVLSNPQPRPPS